MIFLNLKFFLEDLKLISELVLCRTLNSIILEVPLSLVPIECVYLVMLLVEFLA